MNTARGPDEFDLGEATSLLAATPTMLDAWLRRLPAPWLACDEGPDTWNAAVVLGHLIAGERDDWIPRVRHLLAHGETIPFPAFDRFSQLRGPAAKVPELLDEFARLRTDSLAALSALAIDAEMLDRRGQHPEFGTVTLRQHLATWVAHDLTHVVQIARVMARRYADAVGPWRAYLRVVRESAS